MRYCGHKMLNLILMMLALFSSSAMADGAYQQYTCSNYNDMHSCSGSCIKQEYTLDFKVNPSNSTVIKIFFENGKQSNSVVLDKCKVVDNDNWDCSSSFTSGQSMIESEHRLANGIFTAGQSVVNTVDFSRRALGDYYCAKKKGFLNFFD